MYEKMFSALENGQQLDTINVASASRKKPEELFNSTSMSFGKEIEHMHKQFQDEMQQRINELEAQLKKKESDYNELKL